jgi:hypothetical protein
MTQDQRLLDYLRDNKHIDPLQAWQELGIYRLSACVHRLRQVGWEINTEFKDIPNRFGEMCHVANYKWGETDV